MIAVLAFMIIAITLALYIALTTLQEPTLYNRLLTAAIAIMFPLATWGLWRINPYFGLLFFAMVVVVLAWESWRLIPRGGGRHREPEPESLR